MCSETYARSFACGRSPPGPRAQGHRVYQIPDGSAGASSFSPRRAPPRGRAARSHLLARFPSATHFFASAPVAECSMSRNWSIRTVPSGYRTDLQVATHRPDRSLRCTDIHVGTALHPRHLSLLDSERLRASFLSQVAGRTQLVEWHPHGSGRRPSRPRAAGPEVSLGGPAPSEQPADRTLDGQRPHVVRSEVEGS